MNNLLKPLAVQLAVAGALAVSTLSSHAQTASATATIFGVQNGANWDYTVTLDNTGTTNLNSFWYGWIQFENELPSDPSSAANSLNWANDLDANSIQYVNSSGTPLAPGQSATFTFVDSSSPTAITTAPSGESVAYAHGIDFSQGTAGDSTGIITPTLVAAPEPSTFGLLAAGLVAAAFKFKNAARLRR